VQQGALLFSFHIRKPWWQQWWFILLAILAVAALGYLIYWIRVRQLMKVEEMRRDIARDLHDDMGASLSSINIYTSLVRKQVGDSEYLHLIQNHANEIIGKVDELVWSINPRNDNMESLIRRMRLYAEPLLAAAGVSYIFNCDEQVLEAELSLKTRRNLFLIFKELIINVTKHSRASNCTVTLSLAGSELHLAVEDDGIGFNPDESGSGRNGLTNLRERILVIRGKMVIRTHPSGGTRALVGVPV
jgi:signal transduction histidine kinase